MSLHYIIITILGPNILKNPENLILKWWVFITKKFYLYEKKDSRDIYKNAVLRCHTVKNLPRLTWIVDLEHTIYKIKKANFPPYASTFTV